NGHSSARPMSSKPRVLACLPWATSGAGTSSAWPRRSVKDRSPFRSSTACWRDSARRLSPAERAAYISARGVALSNLARIVGGPLDGRRSPRSFHVAHEHPACALAVALGRYRRIAHRREPRAIATARTWRRQHVLTIAPEKRTRRSTMARNVEGGR